MSFRADSNHSKVIPKNLLKKSSLQEGQSFLNTLTTSQKCSRDTIYDAMQLSPGFPTFFGEGIVIMFLYPYISLFSPETHKENAINIKVVQTMCLAACTPITTGLIKVQTCLKPASLGASLLPQGVARLFKECNLHEPEARRFDSDMPCVNRPIRHIHPIPHAAAYHLAKTTLLYTINRLPTPGDHFNDPTNRIYRRPTI